MAQYLIGVDFQAGDDEAPMSDWTPEEVQAHLDYYERLVGELEANGELVSSTILTGPDLAKIVRSDGVAPVVTDGPFQEFKEWLAGFQVVEVNTEERALEIASLMSAVPGRGGAPTRQPIHVRQVMEHAPSNTDEMDDFLRTAGGTR
ncbi:YciI family protein [Terrabacter koreensis]